MTAQRAENRKNKRYVVEGLQGNVLYTSDIDVLNISIDGAAIETPRRLEINREYSFKIKFEENLLNLRGKVVWAFLISKLNKDTGTVMPVYRAGIKFTDTLSEKALLLQNFINQNRTRKLENRLGGVRFKLSGNKTMQVDVPHEYKVKKISMSGMLVETEIPLEIDSQCEMELFINSHSLRITTKISNIREIADESIKKYEVGIEFLKMSEQDEDILISFINSLEKDIL